MNKPDLASLRLETPRLILRPPRMEDFDAWAAMHDDEITTKFIGGRAAAGDRLADVHVHVWCVGHDGRRHVLGHREGERQWVGRLGPWYPEGWPEHEVGWGIAREHWGKGYASEGAAAAMDYAFDVLGWIRGHPLHRRAEPGVAGCGEAARLELPAPGADAGAVRAHARGCLGPDARAVEEKWGQAPFPRKRGLTPFSFPYWSISARKHRFLGCFSMQGAGYIRLCASASQNHLSGLVLSLHQSRQQEGRNFP